MKKKEKKRILSKARGSSIYLYVSMLLLIMVCMLYLNTYTRAADIVSDNIKSSLDAANLAASTINMETFLNDFKNFEITGYASAGPMSAEENIQVTKRFIAYEKALEDNVGLTNSFAFKGGTCGWAADFISNGGLQIDRFIVYDVIGGTDGDTIVAYDISNAVTSYTENPVFSKYVVGKIGDPLTVTPDGEPVGCPTIYSKVSFPLKSATLFQSSFFTDTKKITSQDDKDYANGDKRVSRSSTTGIKLD